MLSASTRGPNLSPPQHTDCASLEGNSAQQSSDVEEVHPEVVRAKKHPHLMSLLWGSGRGPGPQTQAALLLEEEAVVRWLNPSPPAVHGCASGSTAGGEEARTLRKECTAPPVMKEKEGDRGRWAWPAWMFGEISRPSADPAHTNPPLLQRPRRTPSHTHLQALGESKGVLCRPKGASLP